MTPYPPLRWRIFATYPSQLDGQTIHYGIEFAPSYRHENPNWLSRIVADIQGAIQVGEMFFDPRKLSWHVARWDTVGTPLH